MKNVICIYHVPQECGYDSLIFVDTFDGQVIKEIVIDYFHDWDAYHEDIYHKGELILYKQFYAGRGWRIGDKITFEGNEVRPGFKDARMSEIIHPVGKYIIKDDEITDTMTTETIHGPMTLIAHKFTLVEYEESEPMYHPDEDRFYGQLAEQGITMHQMTEEEWKLFSIEDLINLITEQLGYKVLNVINC